MLSFLHLPGKKKNSNMQSVYLLNVDYQKKMRKKIFLDVSVFVSFRGGIWQICVEAKLEGLSQLVRHCVLGSKFWSLLRAFIWWDFYTEILNQ